MFSGNNRKIFVVAEVSANHGQSLRRAILLIKKAKECGCDAVKFQCYTPDTITIDSDNRFFQVKHRVWGKRTLYQLYKQAHTPWRWFDKLKQEADKQGILFFATAFDKTSVDFLDKLSVPFHKISSFEIVDLPLIAHASSKGKCIILSTGMADRSEIREAVNLARKSGAPNVVLLKCLSGYPADPSEFNLRTIPHMQSLYKCPIGISDHTLGIAVPLAASGLGIVMVEKHFTLSRDCNTPDSFFSLEPHEFKMLVANIRIAEKALGRVHYGLTPGQKENKVFRRSLFAVNDIKRGDRFTDSNVRAIRPGYGLAPKYIYQIIGKKARCNIKKGMPLKWSFVLKR